MGTLFAMAFSNGIMMIIHTIHVLVYRTFIDSKLIQRLGSDDGVEQVLADKIHGAEAEDQLEKNRANDMYPLRSR